MTGEDADGAAHSIASLHRAIAAEPGNAAYHYALGRAYKMQGELASAQRSYREALHLRPDYLDAWISLGILLRNSGELAEAERCLRQALSIDPTSSLATLNLGNVFFSQDRLEEAASFFRQAVERDPRSAEAHNNLGRTLLALGSTDPPVHFFEALLINPNYYEAHEGLGRALHRNGSFERAAAAFKEACRIRPDVLATRIWLINSYVSAGLVDDAAAEIDVVRRTNPTVPEVNGLLALVLAQRGHYTKPRALFEEAMRQEPPNPYLQCNYGTFLLRNYEFDRGWDCYEARAAREPYNAAIADRQLPLPMWAGEPLAGRTLLIACEQGLGDEIMFASVFAEIIREADHCVVECDLRLEALFRRSFPQATLFGVTRGGSHWHRALAQNLHRWPQVSCWTPAGTLPRYRRRAANDFPQHRGYLAADEQRTQYWRSRLSDLGRGPKIGISWRGGTAVTNLAARSLGLQQLKPILDTADVHFVNLQYGACSEEINAYTAATGTVIHDWQEAIVDYDETAALVSALDLVISVCTSVVHLGGALGRPVWVMAPRVAEWRYGREGPAMIWYPSVRMFRQPKQGGWETVISDVRRALRKHIGSGS